MSEKTFVGLLGRLVGEEAFCKIHDDLSDFLENYYKNSWQENSSVCCQMVEIHAKLQRDLFHLLKLSTEEGRGRTGNDILQNKLLPWLCNGFVCCGDNNEEIVSLRKDYEARIEELKDQQRDADQNIVLLQSKLEQATMVIDKRNQELYKARENLVKLKLENSDLCNRLTRRFSPSKLMSLSSQLTKTTDDLRSQSNDLRMTCDEVNDDFAEKLVKQFGLIYNNDRVVLMESLESLSGRDTNERLIFNIVQSCFSVAKNEQEKMKVRITEALQPSYGDHIESEQATEIVNNFMKKNIVNFDTAILLTDVFRGVRRKYSPNMSLVETMLSEFTRLVLDVVWFMVSLQPPINIAAAHEGDIIKENSYRRSYMSEFSSKNIHHYVWPCLLRGQKVIQKGEVVTRRLSTYNDLSQKSSTRPQSAEPHLSTSIASTVNTFGSSKNFGFTDKKLSLSWSAGI